MSSNTNEPTKKKTVSGQEVKESQGPLNLIHPIRDFLGKDDNTNKTKNAIDNDVTDKWSFDAFPFEGVVDLGEPPKQIDYLRIASENEQPLTIDFSNDNTLTGYGKESVQKVNLKQRVNVIKTNKDLVARYIRLHFDGNKSLDKDGNKKPDPIGIYYIQVGQGDETKAPIPAPVPGTPEPEPEPPAPPAPTEGRIKDWGGDINKGARSWKVVKMKDNAKLYKVVDAKGTNIADLFSSTDTAQAFIDYHVFKQGDAAGSGGGTDGGGTGGETPTEPPAQKGQDKYGSQLLYASGTEVKYDYRENFRDDGKRYDFNVGEWTQSEATGYFRFTKDPVDDEVSIKWSVVPHSGSNHVKCYDSGVEIRTGNARLRWEDPHPNYSGNLGKGKGEPLPAGKWIGYKGTKTVGNDGSVTIKIFQDTGDNEGTKPSNQWKEIFSHVDTKYKETGKHPFITFRVDDPDKQGQKNLEARWLSVAKI